MNATDSKVPPTTREYTVFVEPVGVSKDEREAARQTLTVRAENALAASLAAVRAYVAPTKREALPLDYRREDPDSATRYRFLRRSDAEEFTILADLSAAEKQHDADVEAAEAAELDAELAAMQPEADALYAEMDRLPFRVRVMRGEVCVEWKTAGRIEVRKRDGWYGEKRGGWSKAAEVSGSSWNTGDDAATLAAFIANLSDAAKVARFLDGALTAGCGELENFRTHTENIREHAKWLAKITGALGIDVATGRAIEPEDGPVCNECGTRHPYGDEGTCLVRQQGGSR